MIPIVIRDDAGAVISSAGTTIALAGNGHTSFVLSTQYPMTANKRGTIEFDTPGWRADRGSGHSYDAAGFEHYAHYDSGAGECRPHGGSIAHLATGNGWQTTFVLVNTGTSAATAHLKFFADTGSPLSLPLAFPQVAGGTTSASTYCGSIAGGRGDADRAECGAAGGSAPTIGSAQLTTDGNIGGFVIFRYNPNGQEAVVPLESRTASAYVIAFDNTSQHGDRHCHQ